MEQYTIQDVRRRRDPADYVQSIVLLGQNTGIAITDATQVRIAYEHMEGQLCRDLSRPNKYTTVESLIEELSALKHVWFDIYSSSNLGIRTQPISNRQGKNYSLEPYGQHVIRTSRFDLSTRVSSLQNRYPTTLHYTGGYDQSNNAYRSYTAEYPNGPWYVQHRPAQGERYKHTYTNQGYNNALRIDGPDRRPLQITAEDTENRTNQSMATNHQVRRNRFSGQQNRPWLNGFHGQRSC